ncbi:SDR family NAD(P)-dependent oxidoreductase [Sphingomonas sp.]|uniref:SDR family NAD(P)-dependent oxidoreductase n=1 Tax=Sphingomonas sp. TaxID=28214 RepID=UPI00286B409A|nr:SDR family NAD(P)-dependent oxidoreductase [Sphingomonas sp.]
MKAIVIGASGGIGAALCDGLESRGAAVIRLSRSSAPPIDLESDPSIEQAAATLASQGPFDLIFVASGILHGAGVAPEKTYRQLDGATLEQVLRINTIGPALVARHFLPLLRTDGRAIFAALSARVGSIGDNRLGGWLSYRASKAALNQIIKTLAIELARIRPETICVALHPGTVDSALSAPFQRGLADGQLLTPAVSATHLLDTLDRLDPTDSGGCFDYRGERIIP